MVICDLSVYLCPTLSVVSFSIKRFLVLGFVGYRASEEILRRVPDVDTFRLALRAIKLWAKSEHTHTLH